MGPVVTRESPSVEKARDWRAIDARDSRSSTWDARSTESRRRPTCCSVEIARSRSKPCSTSWMTAPFLILLFDAVRGSSKPFSS